MQSLLQQGLCLKSYTPHPPGGPAEGACDVGLHMPTASDNHALAGRVLKKDVVQGSFKQSQRQFGDFPSETLN